MTEQQQQSVFRPDQFRIDPSRSIYEQYVEQIRAKIASGVIPSGSRLPSVRDFAGMMRINPATAARTYQELEREKLLETFRGQGTFVTGDQKQIQRARTELARSAVRHLEETASSLGMTMEAFIALAKEES